MIWRISANICIVASWFQTVRKSLPISNINFFTSSRAYFQLSMTNCPSRSQASLKGLKSFDIMSLILSPNAFISLSIGTSSNPPEVVPPPPPPVFLLSTSMSSNLARAPAAFFAAPAVPLSASLYASCTSVAFFQVVLPVK